MTKRGPLSNVEKFYIKEQHNKMSLDALCGELDRAKITVKRHIHKCKKEEEKKEEEQFSPGTPFASRDGVVMMTRAASELGDELRGKKTTTERQSKCVTGTIKKR